MMGTQTSQVKAIHLSETSFFLIQNILILWADKKKNTQKLKKCKNTTLQKV